MVSQKRWKHAQVYERSYWTRAADRIAAGSTGQLGWYDWKACEMEKHLAGILDEDRRRSAKVLEIGSGPVGIISFLKWGERYAVDPLNTFYRSNAVLSHHRSPSVVYAQAIGEHLPFAENQFSLVILDNVLDHTREASAILREINRVLQREGLLYLTINIHTRWGWMLHSLLSKLMIDRGHPYTFRIDTIRVFLKHHQFAIHLESIDDYRKSRDQDRKSRFLKDKIKGHIGLSEFIYTAVASPKGRLS